MVASLLRPEKVEKAAEALEALRGTVARIAV
jgi:hypothetical protein